MTHPDFLEDMMAGHRGIATEITAIKKHPSRMLKTEAEIFKLQIREAQFYNLLLHRVPVDHCWQVEQLLRDTNIQTD